MGEPRSLLTVPLAKPQPDIRRFLDAMDGRIEPEKPPFVEYSIDAPVMQVILEDMLGRTWVDADASAIRDGQVGRSSEAGRATDAWLDNVIAFWHHMGYDFVRLEVGLPLPTIELTAADTAKGQENRTRSWQDMTHGPIKNWDDLERYPWPQVEDGHFYIHEYVSRHLPDGLGFFSCHSGGLLEQACRLMGYERLCLSLYDCPDLLKAVVDRLGQLLLEYNRHLVQFDALDAVFQGDDMGFNTQTLVPPDALREYVLPWHRKYAELAHGRGKRYYLHTCGEVTAIMDDLIDDVGIDAKHSFQDGVFPIIDAKKRYGDRVCLLGGVDVHKLATYDPAVLRKYVREIVDACTPGGRFAIGAGNSIPDYVPVENYLTMLDEARQ